MKIGVINSWTHDVATGTGTTVLINCYLRALKEAGHVLVEMTAKTGETNGPPSVSDRLKFNASIDRQFDAEAFDALLCFDFDGFGLRQTKVPIIAVCAGLFADITPHEQGEAREEVVRQAALEKRLFDRASVILSPSAYAGERLSLLHGIPEDKIIVVPPFLPNPDWVSKVVQERRESRRLSSMKLARGPIRYLSVGRGYPRKRVDLLLRAFAALVSAGVDAELRIVGGGHDFESLSALAKSLGIYSRVTWVGEVRQTTEMEREWVQADAFCHSSLQECFGFVLLEAGLCGIPLIAFDVCANREILGDEASLAPPENVDAFAQAMAAAVQGNGEIAGRIRTNLENRFCLANTRKMLETALERI